MRDNNNICIHIEYIGIGMIILSNGNLCCTHINNTHFNPSDPSAKNTTKSIKEKLLLCHP